MYGICFFLFLPRVTSIFLSIYIYTGWWFQPLWKIWARLLEWLFPIYGKIKHMFQSTNQITVTKFHDSLDSLCCAARTSCGKIRPGRSQATIHMPPIAVEEPGEMPEVEQQMYPLVNLHRPCQIGFGRLVSINNWWFSGSMFIYRRVTCNFTKKHRIVKSVWGFFQISIL